MAEIHKTLEELLDLINSCEQPISATALFEFYHKKHPDSSFYDLSKSFAQAVQAGLDQGYLEADQDLNLQIVNQVAMTA